MCKKIESRDEIFIKEFGQMELHTYNLIYQLTNNGLIWTVTLSGLTPKSAVLHPNLFHLKKLIHRSQKII
jgi:hypothetical protein